MTDPLVRDHLKSALTDALFDKWFSDEETTDRERECISEIADCLLRLFRETGQDAGLFASSILELRDTPPLW